MRALTHACPIYHCSHHTANRRKVLRAKCVLLLKTNLLILVSLVPLVFLFDNPRSHLGKDRTAISLDGVGELSSGKSFNTSFEQIILDQMIAH